MTPPPPPLLFSGKQRLRESQDAAKAGIPLNGRLVGMKASRDNLIRLGRLEEADKVRILARRTHS